MEANQYLDPDKIKGITYTDFVRQIEEQVSDEGKGAPGSRTYYRELNLYRMKRIEKTFQFDERLLSSLSNLKITQEWIVITESWCGDSAQSLPIINRIADLSKGKIRLKIILRDENPRWIEYFHTGGSKSIPKLIAFDDSFNR